MIETKQNFLKEYYGKILTSAKDLRTGVCCTTESLPKAVQPCVTLLAPEIIDKFYGCGSPIPPALDGMTVLDLGCGTGRDAYLIAKLIGPHGKVIGVDMNPEQLAVGQRYIDYQMKQFGHSTPNIEFKLGYIEELSSLGIKDNTIDVVISNCVINLSPDKTAVFKEIFRVLKPGGELYFSDVFADRRLPSDLSDDPLLHAECMGGAMYIEDFRRLMMQTGWPDHRMMTKSKSYIGNPAIENKIGNITFYSMTIRAFKLDTLEDICEDYGQVATYQGTIPDLPHRFALDDHHIFETGKPMLVCGNTHDMIHMTRFGQYFACTGDRSRHYGAFPCGPTPSQGITANNLGSACIPGSGCC